MTALWPLRDTLELGAQPGAVPSARLHARAIVYEWQLVHLADTVELLVTELVTNAVKASAAVAAALGYPPVRLRLSSDRQHVLIEVWDGSVQPPVLTDLNLMAEGGRGLHLVDALSAKWSWCLPQTGGKWVWCEVRPE
jgi:anti-sigma regulatory factor (Ser/Thr protein kinase)